MYKHIGRKDRGFDENYMRKVIAPNAHRFVLIKKSVNEGLGLAPRKGKHTEPHTNPEIKKLMDVYKAQQLHSFKRGRTYGGDVRKVDDLGRGMTKLVGEKLASWVLETTQMHPSDNTIVNDNDESLSESNAQFDDAMAQLDREAETAQMETEGETRTLGHIISMGDGALVFEYDNNNRGEEDDEESEGLEAMES